MHLYGWFYFALVAGTLNLVRGHVGITNCCGCALRLWQAWAPSDLAQPGSAQLCPAWLSLGSNRLPTAWPSCAPACVERLGLLRTGSVRPGSAQVSWAGNLVCYTAPRYVQSGKESSKVPPFCISFATEQVCQGPYGGRKLVSLGSPLSSGVAQLVFAWPRLSGSWSSVCSAHARLSLAQPGSAWLNSVRPGLAQLGSFLFGLAQLAPARLSPTRLETMFVIPPRCFPV